MSTIPTLEEVTSAPYTLLSSVLPGNPAIKEVTNESVTGGLACELNRLRITTEAGDVAFLYAKTIKPGEAAAKSAAELGTAREALFYSRFAPALAEVLPAGSLPVVRFSAGDFATGRKLILLEEVTGAIDSGLCFGMGSPLNWSRAEKVAAAAAAGADPVAVARAAFLLAARMHAFFWNDASLLQHEWLNGTAARRPDAATNAAGEAAFWASQRHASESWKAFLEGRGPAAGLKLPAPFIDLMNASLAKASWADHVAIASSSPFTLAHQDFHPGNMMVHLSSTGEAPKCTLLDFEAVGVGSGPQDLAQYLISHMAPATRRACEKELLAAYHAELVAGGVKGFDADACYAAYVAGGVGRWVWMMAILTQMCPLPMCQYFADQLGAFADDHGVTAANVPMPRV